jgi:energy-coupling factor transport system permease protein
LGAGLVFFYSALRFGWYGQDLFFIRLAIQLVSGVVLGGLLAKVIVEALARTGVVDNFAIGRTRLVSGHATR